MDLSTNQLVVAVVGAYFILLVAIGAAFARSAKSTSDYYKGGNIIPWWAVGLSQYMASFSAYSFVVIAGVVYGKGAFGLLWTCLPPTMLIVGALTFGRRWRRTGLTTPIEYFAVRYSPRFREVFAWLGLISRPLGNGVRMAAFAVLMTAILGYERTAPFAGGLSIPDAVVIGGVAVVILYTLLGGLYGAVVADILQFVILFAALIALFALSWGRIGGIDGALHLLPADFFRLPSLASSEWLWFLAWAVIFFCDYNAAQWGLITRYLGTRSEKDAAKAGVLAGVLYFPHIALAMLPVLVARALNPAIHPESSFGWICREILPGGLVAVMVAAMFSATLSTISAELNSLSGVFAFDIYRARINPHADERRLVFVGRATVLISGAATILIGILVLHSAGLILNAAQQIASYFVIPMAVPMLLGLFTWKANSRSAFAAMIAGALTAWLAYYFPRQWGCSPTVVTLLQNAGTALVSAAVFLISRAWWRSTPDETEKSRRFIDSLRHPAAELAGNDRGFPAPLNVVGACVLVTAAMTLLTLVQPATRAEWPAVVWTGGGLAALGLAALALQPRRRS